MADAVDSVVEEAKRAALAAQLGEANYHVFMPPGMSPEHFERFQQESAYIAQYGHPPPPGMELPPVGSRPPPRVSNLGSPLPPTSRPSHLGAPPQPPAWLNAGVEVSRSGHQHDNDEEDEEEEYEAKGDSEDEELVPTIDPNERRHSSLGDLDMDDLHEIHEGDLAQLDDGKTPANDAGIIDDSTGVPLNVQPAVPVKEEEIPKRSLDDSPIPEASMDPPEVVRRRSAVERSQRRLSRAESNRTSLEKPMPFPGEENDNAAAAAAAAAATAAAAAAAETVMAASALAAVEEHHEEEESGELPPVEKRRSSRLLVAAGALMEKVLRPLSSRSLSANAKAASAEQTAASEEASSELPAAPLPPPTIAQPPSPTPARVPPSPEIKDPVYVNIKARTLAGKIFPLDNLDRTITFFELRELIHEMIPNIPVAEQRLLYKGKIMDSVGNAATLRDIGFKDGDVIHVVRQLQSGSPAGAGAPGPQAAAAFAGGAAAAFAGGAAAAPAPAPAPAAAHMPAWGGVGMQGVPPSPQPQYRDNSGGHASVASSGGGDRPRYDSNNPEMLTVLVPAGRRTGDRLRIHPPGRAPMLVTVPDGVYEGMPFRVQLPPLSHDTLYVPPPQPSNNNRRSMGYASSPPSHMHAPPPSTQNRQSVNVNRLSVSSQQSRAAPPQPSGDRLMAVVVPPRYRAGMVMEIMVPGKGRMRVAIPEGVSPGQQFRFRVPA